MHRWSRLVFFRSTSYLGKSLALTITTMHHLWTLTAYCSGPTSHHCLTLILILDLASLEQTEHEHDSIYWRLGPLRYPHWLMEEGWNGPRVRVHDIIFQKPRRHTHRPIYWYVDFALVLILWRTHYLLGTSIEVLGTLGVTSAGVQSTYSIDGSDPDLITSPAASGNELLYRQTFWTSSKLEPGAQCVLFLIFIYKTAKSKTNH